MTTDTVGGVWIYATGLARKLCETGHEVTLVTLGPAPRREQVEQVSGTPRLSLDVTGLALEWMDAEGHDLPRARDTLLRIAERVRPDVVHLNSFREAAFDFGVPVLVVAHSCVGSWWQACRPSRAIESRWQTYLRNVADGLNAACRWAAPTVTYRDWVEAFYRPRTLGEAIWNGTDLPYETGYKQKAILAAGRLWDEGKNLRALASVANEVDWPIFVAGSLDIAHATMITAVGNLRVLGELPHRRLLAQMQHAAIFVAPALYEPFGLGILEAAGRRCALVLSDIATLRELWRDAALFVEPGDACAVRDALNTLCRDGGLRARLGAAAHQRAWRYSSVSMVRSYQRLYSDLTQAAPVTCRPRTSAMELRP